MLFDFIHPRRTPFADSFDRAEDGPAAPVDLRIKLNVAVALFCSAAMPLLSFLGGLWPLMLLPLGDALWTIRRETRTEGCP